MFKYLLELETSPHTSTLDRYDDNEHDLIIVTMLLEGDKILLRFVSFTGVFEEFGVVRLNATYVS